MADAHNSYDAFISDIENAEDERIANEESRVQAEASRVTRFNDIVAEVEQDIVDMNVRIDDAEATIDAFQDDLNNRIGGFYGENFAGKVFMVGEDGYLVLEDITSGGSAYPVVGIVDDNNVITLSSDELVDGLYTLRYSDGLEYKSIGVLLVGERRVTSITATKGQTLYEQGDSFNTDDITVTAYYNDLTSEVVTDYTINSSSVNMNEGGTYQLIISYGGCSTNISIIVSANAIVTGNLFVASTCTIGKRISSTGVIKDQTNTFITDYIEIGKVMAAGGENIIHWKGFHLYKRTSSDLADAGVTSEGSSYTGVAYYNTAGEFLGQDSLYVADKVYDSEGNFQLVLNSTYSTATKLRLFGMTLPFATSTNDLQNCKLTLNQLISEI